jgi:hypothetical protein
MNLLTIANAGANAIIAAAVVDMAIRVFGNRQHRIHDHPELFWARKAISSMVICGAVLNIATLSTPSWTECLLNYAFALNYCFSSFYDRFTSSINPANAAKVPKRNPTRRAASASKGKQNSSTSVYRGKRTSTR